MVRAQGRENTQCSFCSQPFADVAVTAGTPQPLGLYRRLGCCEAALIWKPQSSCPNRTVLGWDLPKRILMSHQSWLLPGKLQGLWESSASIWPHPCRQIPDLLQASVPRPEEQDKNPSPVLAPQIANPQLGWCWQCRQQCWVMFLPLPFCTCSQYLCCTVGHVGV